jgi:ABC-2 type transport system permease protein
VRSLLAKDVLILRRSRLLVALLVLYPLAIALLIGLAISRGPARPRVAVLDETPPGQTVRLGNQQVSVSGYALGLLSQVQALPVHSRGAALADVRSGAAVAALVIPPDIASRITSGVSRGTVEVLYNGNALEQSLVRSTIDAAIAQANLVFSEQIQRAAAQAIDALLKGRELGILGAPPGLIGLEQIPAELHGIAAREPRASVRRQLLQIEAFARFAARNLVASKDVLATIGQPIQVHSRLLHGRLTPLNTFGVVVAATISLMFVAVLLAAGSLASEREERTLPRLLRGLVSRRLLLAEKTLLAAASAFAVGLALLAVVSAFVTLGWGRFGLWVIALGAGAIAFGALGAAVGALAKEVRAASLLAFLLSLPVAFLALVPSGSVSGGFYDAISVISFVFPFKAALQALDCAVNHASPGLGVSVAHLAGLTVAFGALAGFGLRANE